MDSIVGLLIIAIAFGAIVSYLVVWGNIRTLKGQGHEVKQRVFMHSYLGGHPDMEGPQKTAIIYPKMNSLFIYYYENSNLFNMPKLGGEILNSSVISVTTENSSNFLIIEWKGGGSIHKTTFQYPGQTKEAVIAAKDKLLKIIDKKV